MTDNTDTGDDDESASISAQTEEQDSFTEQAKELIDSCSSKDDLETLQSMIDKKMKEYSGDDEGSPTNFSTDEMP